MASDFPVCGERLADGVLSRDYQAPEATWFEELSEPARPTEGGSPVEEEGPAGGRHEGGYSPESEPAPRPGSDPSGDWCWQLHPRLEALAERAPADRMEVHVLLPKACFSELSAS